MSRFVEIGYPISEAMQVYPGLPDTRVQLRESMDKGDDWNGSVLSIYLHAGTHCDSPWHYYGGDSPRIDNTEIIPTDRFLYEKPVLVDVTPDGPDYLIRVEDICRYKEACRQADLILFNTGYWKYRAEQFETYANHFPALSPEAARWLRKECPNLKAVGIDTLSIENIANGHEDGFQTHRTLLEWKTRQHPVLIYEDINPEPLIGKKLIRAFCTPLRIHGDASICNVICEVEE